jgi:3-oxoacyl-[acyl-carrier-protein] synthase II
MSAAIVAFGAVSALGEGPAAVSVGAVGERARVALSVDPELTLAGLARPFAARVSLGESSVDRATSILNRAALGCAHDLDSVLPSWRTLRVGLALGTSSGGMRSAEQLFAIYSRGEGPGLPAIPASAFYFSPMLEVVAALGIEPTPATLVLGACAASALAIGLGCRWLEEDACDLVLAGGFDAVSVFVASGFEVLRATTAALPPRPFRLGRDGMALGEGAAVLALRPERLASHARAYVTGFGASSDAVHITAPDRTGRGLAAAGRAALTEADVTEVDLISAHATATSFSDAAEARAIAELFPHSPQTLVHPFKAQVGHTLGASAALEVLACVDAMERGVLPAAAGEGPVDPDTPVQLLSVCEAGKPRTTLKLSAAFGGANAALVVAREPRRGGVRQGPRSVYLGLPVTLADVPPAAALAGQIGWPVDRVGRADVLTRLALAAVAELVKRDGSLTGAAIVVGASFATLETNASFFARIQERGPRMAEPRRFPYTSPNAAAGDCSAAFGLTGASFAVGSGLHAGLEALVVGSTLVRSGDAERVVVVAVDEIGPVATRLAMDLRVEATTGVVAAVLSADPSGAIAKLGACGLGVGAGTAAPIRTGHTALLPLLRDPLPRVLEASSCDYPLPRHGSVRGWARVELLPQN